MKLEISVPEVVSIFKEIQKQPDKIYEMIRADIRETIGQYLSVLICGAYAFLMQGIKHQDRIESD